MSWENVVLAVTSWVFAVALLPAVVKRRPPHPLSSALTAVCLVGTVVAEAGLHLYLASGSTAITAALWGVLFVQGLSAEG